ncbi:MAG: MGMT family protein [Thermofilum sp.]
MSVEVACAQTSLGKLCAAVREREVLLLHTEDFLARTSLPGIAEPAAGGDLAASLLEELQEYLCGERRVFSYRPRLPEEGVSSRVFREVLRIPYGEVTTYGQLARRTGLGPRAVGRILGRNPVLVLIPCHRVVGSRSLGGYALGAERKRLLLMIEGALTKFNRTL